MLILLPLHINQHTPLFKGVYPDLIQEHIGNGKAVVLLYLTENTSLYLSKYASQGYSGRVSHPDWSHIKLSMEEKQF